MRQQVYYPRCAIVFRELDYAKLNPVQAYLAVGGIGACMLESAYDEGYGNYSFIGINPLATFSSRGRKITITSKENVNEFEQDPYLALNDFAYQRKAFGFVGYSAIRLKENLPSQHESNKLPDFLFHIYKTVIKFDHPNAKIIISHEGSDAELDLIVESLLSEVETKGFIDRKELDIECDLSDNEFIKMVKQAQEYIKAGDIFQIVLSRTFTAQIASSAFTIYRALRQLNPTPYMAFFEEDDYAIASASPELLVGVKDGVVETIPIAGTIKTGDDYDKLINDPKENAEHVMLVDLARNDIGFVAEIGSVKVSEYKVIKSYAYVSHIVSRVIGLLRPQLNSLNALKAVLPAGTLSGAPKIRAMQLIDQLENSDRGLYGGAIILIDEQGDLISSIAIRTAIIYPDKVEVRTGAGIVFDSIPEKEAEETKLKARGVIAALELVNGGLK